MNKESREVKVQKLIRLERLIMVWPRAKRVQLEIQALRKDLGREEQLRRRILRGRIVRALGGCDEATLCRVLTTMGLSCAIQPPAGARA